MERENVIVNMTFTFALKIVEYTEKLETMGKRVVARQLIRSGTSIGANVNEAQSAASPRDFLNKMRIAAKEAEETKYWLSICKHSQTYPDCDEIIEEAGKICRILAKITHSTKKRIADGSK